MSIKLKKTDKKFKSLKTKPYRNKSISFKNVFSVAINNIPNNEELNGFNPRLGRQGI